MTPIKAATQAQESALNAPMKYYGAATGQIQPSNALYGTLSDQRYSVASPNQWYTPPTITSGCFPAGTQVNTPDGMKNIETIQVGDTVSTADDGDTMVIAVMEPRQEMVIILATNKGNIVCSNSQPFFDEDYEEITAHNIKVGESIMHVSGMVKITSKLYVHLSPKTVYNFTTQTGDYLVNGFVASDWGGQ
jgi:hypothetical protein